MKIIFVIIIIGALAAGGFFLKDYFSQTSAADTLREQIAASSGTLKVVTAANAPLAGEINDIKARQVDVQKSIAGNTAVPFKMNTNDVVRSILSAGGKYSLDVIPLSTSDWAAAKIGQDSYGVFKMTLQLNGSQESIVGFLKYIQDSLYPTLVIENLDLTQAPAAEIGMMKANLALSIYAR